MSHITGIATHDCETVGRLVALKTLLNEFVAYLELMRATDLSKRSVAIATYALVEGHLQRVFDEHGLPWKGEELGRKLVDAAARQIYASVEARGETSYSLVLPNGRPNSGRVAAVAKYLDKVVAKRADARKESKQHR